MSRSIVSHPIQRLSDGFRLRTLIVPYVSELYDGLNGLIRFLFGLTHRPN